MGGAAIVNSVRMNSEEYQDMVDYIGKVLFAVSHRVTYKIRESDSHGDVDVIVPEQHRSIVVLFNPVKSILNGNVVSIGVLRKGVLRQIDFVFCTINNWENQHAYCSYAGMGFILGICLIKYDLQYGCEGLKLRVGTGNNKQWLMLSEDLGKIFEFIGLSVERFHQGFNTHREFYDYLFTRCKYSSIGTVRDYFEKCPTQKYRERIMEYFESHWKYARNEESHESGWESAHLALEFFGKYGEYSEFLRTVQNKAELHDKFNGNIVSRVKGLTEGKELGKYIKAFKSVYSDEFLLARSAEEIVGLLENFLV